MTPLFKEGPDTQAVRNHSLPTFIMPNAFPNSTRVMFWLSDGSCIFGEVTGLAMLANVRHFIYFIFGWLITIYNKELKS
jgi:hypothetical protein